MVTRDQLVGNNAFPLFAIIENELSNSTAVFFSLFC